MPTFLAPAALFGLSLLAIPIVIHLLKPRKMRRTPFSSLRWLQLTQQKLSRRLRWHQIFLFLLRAAFIAVLVAAVAKPVLDRRAASEGNVGHGPTERFVVLDISRSMGYRPIATGAAEELHKSLQPTPLETGKRAAAALLAGGGPNDRTALLTVGSTTKILGPLARGGDRYAPKLSPLTAEPTGTDLGSALDTIQTLTARSRPDAKIELYLITDRNQGSLRPEAVEAFVAENQDRISTTIVDAGLPAASNVWIADAVYLPAESGSPPAVEVQLRAVGTTQERTVRVVGIAGREDRSRTITLGPDKPVSITFELPAEFDGRGKVCEVVLDPSDGLPTDDRWYLSFDSGSALDVLIVEGRGQADAKSSPGFTLRTAIEALSASSKPIRVTSKKFNEIEPADFAAVDAVLWADVPQLSDVALDALAARVRGGLGLGIFLGPDVDAEFYNRRLIDPLDRAKSLLPMRLDRIADVPLAEGGSAPLESAAWKHPLLVGLFDPTIGDMAHVRVRSYYRFAGLNDGSAAVVASVAGSPFIMQQAVGQGSVVVFNTTADDTWSDLPRRKSFVPLLDRLLNQLTGGGTKQSFLTGEAIAFSIVPLADAEQLKITSPTGEALTPTVAAAGNRARVSLPPQTQPGVYQVRREGDVTKTGEAEPATFVVQVDRADSALVPIPDDALRSWWLPARCEVVAAATVAGGTIGGETSLIGWAVLLAALLLASEMFVVHRLCPRMNPQAAASIVARKPIVASSTRGETIETSLPPMVRNA